MVDAVDHNTPSAIGTGVWEAGKGALLGAAAITIVGAVLGVLLLPFSGLTSALIGAAGGLLTSATVAAPLTGGMALFGGLFGLARGGSRVSREKAEFRRQMEGQSGGSKLAQRIHNERLAGLQEGYATGAHDAEVRIANQLQAMAMQEQASGASAPGAMAIAGATAEAKCDCGPHTKAVIQREQAAAAAAAAGKTPTV